MVNRLNQDTLSGLGLLAVCSIGYWQVLALPFFADTAIGSGAFPKTILVLISLIAVFLVIRGLVSALPPPGVLHLRSIFFISIALVVFAYGVKTLGLAIAGFAAVVLAFAAEPPFHIKKSLVYAFALTLFCIVLFVLLLRLNFPVLPPFLRFPL